MLLESELAFNNLQLQLMREEAYGILFEAEAEATAEGEAGSKSNVKDKAKQLGDQAVKGLKEVVKKIVELFNTFVAKIKQVINKVVVASNVAKKFIASHRENLSKFAGSSQLVKVTPYLANRSSLGEEFAKVKTALACSNRYLHLQYADMKGAQALLNEIKKVEAQIGKQATHASTSKIDTKLSTGFVDSCVSFIEKEYSALSKTSSELANGAREVTARVQAALKYRGEDRRTIMGHSIMGRTVIFLLMRVAGQLISIMNQMYVDAFKVVRVASGTSKKDSKEGFQKRTDDNNDKVVN
jgi:hypothetical protein